MHTGSETEGEKRDNEDESTKKEEQNQKNFFCVFEISLLNCCPVIQSWNETRDRLYIIPV